MYICTIIKIYDTGATGGGLRNAFGMIAFIYAQQWATTLNLRGER